MKLAWNKSYYHFKFTCQTIEENEPEIRYLFPIIKDEELLRIHVHRADDVAGLLLRREINFKATVEHLCDINKNNL